MLININKVLLYSTGNYIQYSCNKPQRIWKIVCVYIYICITESLCSYQNLIQHCKASILHLKVKIKEVKVKIKDFPGGPLVVQWLSIHLQGTWVWSLILEDSTCHGATKPVCHHYLDCPLEPVSYNYWSLHA